MSHIASQILAAVETRLSAVATVHYVPVHVIQAGSLPAIIIQDIEDETGQSIGPGPLNETHRLSFEVFGVVAHSASGFATVAGDLRASIESALLAAINDIRLGGLCRPGLSRPSAQFRVDADSLQVPVGGWALKFQCVYQLKTDAPDTPI